MPRDRDTVNRRQALNALGAAAGAAALANVPTLAAAPAVRTGYWPACIVTPEQTEGPYFVDEKLERADIRKDPADGTTREGLPLRLRMSVHRVDGNACTPITGAHVDLWQCDVSGVYAGVRDQQGLFDTREKKFLRGYQVSDAKGAVEFLTIYPGWYPGRTPHIHFKVRLYAGQRRSYEFTSQLYFDDAFTDRIYARPPYSRPGERVTNGRDGIYRREGGDKLMLALTEVREEVLGGFEIGLRMS
ncbi:MAG: intradiol ring-cleavage dioxygenase [Gemmatimonadales bacterium]